MKMEKMVLVGVDDHIIEPPNAFDNRQPVSALRPAAAARGVDTSIVSQGGETPVTVDDRRPVTSGDVIAMFGPHAEPAGAGGAR